jgi:hypothetical protein
MKNKKYLYTYRIADIVFSIFSKNEIRTTENFFPFIYQGEKKDFIIQLEEKESMPFEMNNVLFENYIFKAGKDKEGYYIIEFSVITKRITDRMLNPEFMIMVWKKYVI